MGYCHFVTALVKNAIEERITAIMKTKKTTIFSLVLACLIVVGVATAFATSAQANNNPILKNRSTNQYMLPRMLQITIRRQNCPAVILTMGYMKNMD